MTPLNEPTGSGETGQALPEYSLIVAIVSLALVVILILFRNQIGNVLAAVAKVLGTAT